MHSCMCFSYAIVFSSRFFAVVKIVVQMHQFSIKFRIEFNEVRPLERERIRLQHRSISEKRSIYIL